MTDSPTSETQFDRRILRASMIALACIGAVLLLFKLVDLLLLIFACALTALILVTVARLIQRRIAMPYSVALTLTVLIMAGVLVGAFWFFGAEMAAQFADLTRRLPGAWTAVQGRLQGSEAGSLILARAHEFAPSSANIVALLTNTLSIGGEILSGLVVVIVGGLYLAAQPGLYAGGMLKLIPEKGRPQLTAAFDAVAASLRGWLKGQALGMLFVGVGTGVGLGIVGVPAALAIGLVAGLGEFVPYLGTILAGIPAVILGFSQGTDTGLWALAVLLGVQQIQGHLVMPLLQNKMVDLPPAVTVFGIIAAGLLLGPVGILLATPLTVVILVLVRRLYLGEDVPNTANG